MERRVMDGIHSSASETGEPERRLGCFDLSGLLLFLWLVAVFTLAVWIADPWWLAMAQTMLFVPLAWITSRLVILAAFIAFLSPLPTKWADAAIFRFFPPKKVSCMDILQTLRDRAAKLNKTIALPEADDDRTIQAAADCLKQGIAKILLIGNPAAIAARAKALGVDVSKAIIRDPEADPDYEKIVAALVECRKSKGMTPDQAKAALKDTITYAAVLVRMGLVDGYVSGAVHSTADTLRPALQIIKPAPGVKTVSAFFMMVLPDSSPYASKQRVLFYADSGLVQNPNAEELAHIALNTARSWKQLIPGQEPVVAMLSHSTKGSAKHPDVDKVVEATKIAQQLAADQKWDLPIDGELQADAALIESVGKSKAKGSAVAGHANVLVFPDLDAGNIAYKLTERLAGATAIGPLISGMAKPINDLSRGCKASDIVDAVAVTVCQGAE